MKASKSELELYKMTLLQTLVPNWKVDIMEKELSDVRGWFLKEIKDRNEQFEDFKE